ncbi:DNA-binding response regulator [Dictyobacter formicarum]|uniref:DNA-binding response regulator n=2 Tax=Dictyobacter formicarum TaxID=2778368 RepID=A0ABQ3VBJ5_9CHLR|nr:DNA-binding response regulator [Dictyobacter formicarum]
MSQYTGIGRVVKMTKILVVEDEKQIMSFLRRGLMYKGFEVIGAANGNDAIRQAHDAAPDLVILDIMLSDFDGFEICRYLRSTGSETLPILMLTARDDLTDKIAGLDCGADDYITKPFDFEELIARIRAALRRVESLHQANQRIETGDLVIDTSAHQAWRAGQLIELTRREYDLLEFLAQNPGHVLSKERIFERVWGYDNEAELEVIKVYINYLRSKLNAGGKPDLIHAVRGIGYVLRA